MAFMLFQGVNGTVSLNDDEEPELEVKEEKGQSTKSSASDQNVHIYNETSSAFTTTIYTRRGSQTITIPGESWLDLSPCSIMVSGTRYKLKKKRSYFITDESPVGIVRVWPTN